MLIVYKDLIISTIVDYVKNERKLREVYNDLIISTYRRSEYTTIALIPVYKDYIIYFIFL